MKKERTIRFATAARNRKAAMLFLLRRVPFSVSEDGTIKYSSQFDEVVDFEILSNVRAAVFPRWQVLSFPPEWAGVYSNYIRRKKLRFAPEWVNGRLVYLLPASYRPHSWTLPDPNQTADRKLVTCAVA